ncbi:hypothetical protein KIW84_057223, partial [Lathyrus oleraceus]
HNIHNQPFENQQDFKTAMPKVEETEFKNGSQVGFSPSQYQQRSALPGQNNPNVPAEVEETEFKNGSQVGFSPSQYQQRSALPGQNNPNVPAEVSSGQVSIAGVNSGQPQQFRGFSGSMQQPAPTMQSQQGGSDLFYQHVPNFQNQL